MVTLANGVNAHHLFRFHCTPAVVLREGLQCMLLFGGLRDGLRSNADYEDFRPPSGGQRLQFSRHDLGLRSVHLLALDRSSRLCRLYHREHRFPLHQILHEAENRDRRTLTADQPQLRLPGLAANSAWGFHHFLRQRVPNELHQTRVQHHEH